MTPVLECSGLTVAYGSVPVVSDVSFSLAAGECLALVGVSGSGKSTIAQAVLGLHGPMTRVSGQLQLLGHDLLSATERELAGLRGKRVGYVSQDPYSACDPLRSVGHHVEEAWRSHGMRPEPGLAIKHLSRVGIEDAHARAAAAPHRWSGGMLQRACIAAAGAHKPPLIVADEPTSALDADRADGILMSLRASGAAVLLISHDLDLVRRHADRVAILHEGQIVDDFPVSALDDTHRHEATRRLFIASSGDRCADPPAEGDVLVTADGILRRYGAGSRPIGPFSFTVRSGTALGLSGPSGSGKSTILRVLTGQDMPDEGGMDLAKALQRPGAIMPVFQNPAASLNALWPIWRTVSEPATVRHRLRRAQRKDLARRLLAQVGLADADLDARPGEFSLGQCQRIAIARAIAAGPHLLIADEPTSALDTVSRAQVADVLAGLVRDGMALVIASHDPWLHDRLNTQVVRTG